MSQKTNGNNPEGAGKPQKGQPRPLDEGQESIKVELSNVRHREGAAGAQHLPAVKMGELGARMNDTQHLERDGEESQSPKQANQG